MKDIEIILIDDCSEDNSVKYVEEVQTKDPRIIFIKNKKNMGILYSRGIGVVKARGKYIFPFDSDDLIMTDDLFDYIYEEIEKGKYDIIEFSWINSYIYELVENSFYNKPFCVHSLDEVIYQPELRQRFNRDEKGNLLLPDRYIWGKIISKDLYTKSIEVIGEDLEQKITAHEDTIIGFMLFKYGKSFKKIGKIGICHFLLETSTSYKMYFINEFETTCLSYTNYIDILYKHIENTTMAKEDAFYEFDHWILQSQCKYNKYGLEKKINLIKKFYNDSMIPKYRRIIIQDFLYFIKLNINNSLTKIILNN
jgi:glycosyltransferase involved in cell wall biosynthesis